MTVFGLSNAAVAAARQGLAARAGAECAPIFAERGGALCARNICCGKRLSGCLQL